MEGGFAMVKGGVIWRVYSIKLAAYVPVSGINSHTNWRVVGTAVILRTSTGERQYWRSAECAGITGTFIDGIEYALEGGARQ